LVKTESESDAGGDEASREELQSKIKRQADEIENLKGEKKNLVHLRRHMYGDANENIFQR